MRRANKTEYVILGLLTIEPMSGYDMKAVISDSLNFFWAASYGQLYPTLKRLHEDGCVSRDIQAEDGKPSRHVYEITELGRQKLEDWLVAEIDPEPIRNELLLKLFFGSNVDKSALTKHIDSFHAQQEKRLKTFRQIEKTTLKSAKKDPSYPFFASTLKYGIHIARARMRWCKESMSLLNEKRNTKSKR